MSNISDATSAVLSANALLASNDEVESSSTCWHIREIIMLTGTLVAITGLVLSLIGGSHFVAGCFGACSVACLIGFLYMIKFANNDQAHTQKLQELKLMNGQLTAANQLVEKQKQDFDELKTVNNQLNLDVTNVNTDLVSLQNTAKQQEETIKQQVEQITNFANIEKQLKVELLNGKQMCESLQKQVEEFKQSEQQEDQIAFKIHDDTEQVHQQVATLQRLSTEKDKQINTLTDEIATLSLELGKAQNLSVQQAKGDCDINNTLLNIQNNVKAFNSMDMAAPLQQQKEAMDAIKQAQVSSSQGTINLKIQFDQIAANRILLEQQKTAAEEKRKLASSSVPSTTTTASSSTSATSTSS